MNDGDILPTANLGRKALVGLDQGRNKGRLILDLSIFARNTRPSPFPPWSGWRCSRRGRRSLGFRPAPSSIRSGRLVFSTNRCRDLRARTFTAQI